MPMFDAVAVALCFRRTFRSLVVTFVCSGIIGSATFQAVLCLCMLVTSHTFDIQTSRRRTFSSQSCDACTGAVPRSICNCLGSGTAPPESTQVCVSRGGSPVAVEWLAAGAAGGKCPPRIFWGPFLSLSKEKTSFSIGNHEFHHPCFALY